MTIPAATWCADCQEECSGHSRICITCGGPLTVRPEASTNNRPSVSFRAMPDITDFLLAGQDDTAANTLHNGNLLADLRRQVQETTALTRNVVEQTNRRVDALAVGATPADIWQTIPAALLDPQNNHQSSSTKRPTSKECLDKLPRETLTETSPSLYSVSIEIEMRGCTNTILKFEGVTGKFGKLPSIPKAHGENDFENSKIQVEGPLWIPKSRAERTGKEPFHSLPESSSSHIVVLERGHGIPFVTKSYAAQQQANASAVIIMNDKSEPWPYCMNDSRSPTQKQQQPITIPVVMVSQASGQSLLQELLCSSNKDEEEEQFAAAATTPSSTSITVRLSIQYSADIASCVICTDPLALGQTIVTLTNYCGHTFHERCALQWLEQHNTCPYCRRTLPTENAEHEQERRRQMTRAPQRDHHNEEGTAGTGDAFYG